MSPNRRRQLRRRCWMTADDLALSFRSMSADESCLAREVDARLRQLALLLGESLPKNDAVLPRITDH